MMRRLRALCFLVLLALLGCAGFGQAPAFRAIAFYSTHVEQDHVDFALQAIPFFEAMAKRDGFEFKATSDWNEMNPVALKQYQVVLWLDDAPSTAAQRAAFEDYMEHGGGWFGFHIAGWMDGRQTWPWFADFLGTLFYGNSWPPLPATLTVDDPQHPAMKGVPSSFLSPANEWYSWDPNPRRTPGVKVLMTLDPSNYPIGFKDTLEGGDIPVTWTNTKYRMLYTNMGHGDKIFANPEQNRFFESALLWLGNQSSTATAQKEAPRFRALALAEAGGIHKPFVDRAMEWLNALAKEDNFEVDYLQNTDKIDDEFLSHYQLFIQLNYPPYNWTPTAQAAFVRYIEEGRGGWIGFHHATLLGEFDGFKMWPWFSDFMGGIRFTAYIPGFADGMVTVEDPLHPAMKGVSTPFLVQKEEWYTWSQSPRANVHVLASVNENTYSPDSKTKMGDHPVIWSNDHYKARNIYIFMGHHPELFQNPAFTTIFKNSIFWAARQPQNP